MRQNFLIYLTILFCYTSAHSMPSTEGSQGSTVNSPEPASVPYFEHQPVTFGTAGQAILIEAKLYKPGKSLVYARVYFKSSDKESFQRAPLRPGLHGLVGEIPAKYIKVPGIQYFLLALFDDQEIISYPERNPHGQAFEVIIKQAETNTESIIIPPKSGKSPDVKSQSKQNSGIKGSSSSRTKKPLKKKQVGSQELEKLLQLEGAKAGNSKVSIDSALTADKSSIPITVLNPEPFSQILQQDLLIAASFQNPSDIDSNSVSIFLDKKDVTNLAKISEYLVTFTPEMLSAGEHQIAIVVQNQRKKKAYSVKWQFQVISESIKNLAQDEEQRSQFSGGVFAETRHEKFGGSSLDNTNIGSHIHGQYKKVSYSASTYITSLEDKNFQPRNRFVFSATMPGLSLTLGDATPYFNDLILWGKRVRGLQAQLYTGIFNIDFVIGQTARGITPVTGKRFGSFRQNLLGIRPYFGNKSIQLGFTLMKARDDSTSISTVASPLSPQDNLTVGTDLLINLHNRRIELKASAAHSWVTTDITNAIVTKAFIDSVYGYSLPFDPKDFKSFLIINESTAPLDPGGLTALAYQFNLRLNYYQHFVNIGFKQIGSAYKTFGQPFLRSDIKGFYVNDRFRLLKNRLFVNLGFEHYKDHFKKISTQPSTDLNTFNIGMTLNWQPDLPALNVSFRNHQRENDIRALTETLIQSMPSVNPSCVT